MIAGRKITAWLTTTRPIYFNLYCMVVAFSTYFCMYAFRKPFTIGAYAGTIALPFLPVLDFKSVLLIAQIFGYTISKFMGIKMVSGAQWDRRPFYLLASITIAELALLGFAAADGYWRILFIFINGIPLGMIWGFVFSYLEGRKATELLAGALSVSYIVSSGAVKTVGKEVLALGVDPYWMPMLTGCLFLPFFFLAVKLLSLIPPPTVEEEFLKTKRRAMTNQERKDFFLRYAPGLCCLVVFFMFLTAFRDFRDNFAREIWQELGFGHSSLVFTVAEIPIALAVLLILGLLMLVRNNERALLITHLLIISGSATIVLSTFLFSSQMISPEAWMIAVGFGCYLAYVPFGTVLYDRIIAVTHSAGTAGFMMYVTDSFGYLGSVGLLLYKNFATLKISWLQFFIGLSYVTGVVCSLGFFIPLIYFRYFTKRDMVKSNMVESLDLEKNPLKTVIS
jgi:hypothetical protein